MELLLWATLCLSTNFYSPPAPDHRNIILVSFITSGDAKPKYSQSHVPPAKLQERKRLVSKEGWGYTNSLFSFFQTCAFQTLRWKHVTSFLGLLGSHLGPLPWQQRPETPASSVAPNRLHGWFCVVASADTAGSPSELSLQSPSPNPSGKIIKTVVQKSSQKSTQH